MERSGPEIQTRVIQRRDAEVWSPSKRPARKSRTWLTAWIAFLPLVSLQTLLFVLHSLDLSVDAKTGQGGDSGESRFQFQIPGNSWFKGEGWGGYLVVFREGAVLI